MRKDVTVVLRESGERTLPLCYDLVAAQVPEAHIIVIREAPFSAAVRRTFEIGIEQGRPWTLALNADVLLRPDAVERLMSAGEHEDDGTLYEIQGLILDKLFGGPKPGNPHLYRTAHLEAAIPLIQGENQTARPESNTYRLMQERGYRWVQGDQVLGLEDYEQYYRDIFRKSYTHADKHGRYTGVLARLWKQLSDDPDYQIALMGLRAAEIFGARSFLDQRTFPTDISPILALAGLEEKPETEFDITADDVEQMVLTFQPSPEYEQFLILREEGPTASHRHIKPLVQAGRLLNRAGGKLIAVGKRL